jgi:hypothetical protein
MIQTFAGTICFGFGFTALGILRDLRAITPGLLIILWLLR